jgi:hypothetical protein
MLLVIAIIKVGESIPKTLSQDWKKDGVAAIPDRWLFFRVKATRAFPQTRACKSGSYGRIFG